MRRLMLEHGLLDRQYGSYAVKVSSALALLIASIAILVVFDSLWVQLANAALMACAFSQFAFLGHDSGHRQVFRSVKRNDMLMMLAALVTGLAPSWWQEKHTKHHVSPNQIGHDGDIEISVFAFTRGQALDSWGVARFFIRHQAFWFYPMLLLTSYSLLSAGIAFLVRLKGVKYPVLEPIVVVTAIAAYLALVFTFLPFWHGVLFIVVHRGLLGLHLGSVFAPNHKGMPILAPGTELDHLRQQVLTSRNVIPNPVIDYLYGGLNYQIEHHLFPNMPRNRLKDARPVVRAFCADHGVPYHETGFWRSNQEILSYLHTVSAPLRHNRSKPVSSLDCLAGGPTLPKQNPAFALF
ncbi:MAG: acyl-CoA desaturase [Chloroflexi bacterium]|nr:acyl-CoA desaturase [Chloroflexota bacterium]MYD48598.1 acyl-CoA desaturase [Chloroflexota bacterium]